MNAEELLLSMIPQAPYEVRDITFDPNQPDVPVKIRRMLSIDEKLKLSERIKTRQKFFRVNAGHLDVHIPASIVRAFPEHFPDAEPDPKDREKGDHQNRKPGSRAVGNHRGVRCD